MPQFLPHFSEASHAPKIFLFLAVSQLKGQSVSLPYVKLVVHPEADGSDLCMADSGKLPTACSPNATAFNRL